VLSTLSAVGGNSGSLSYHAQSYLENGERLLSDGSGTYESSGNNRWRTISHHSGLQRPHRGGRRCSRAGEPFLEGKLRAELIFLAPKVSHR
jgi:hypothetical protein